MNYKKIPRRAFSTFNRNVFIRDYFWLDTQLSSPFKPDELEKEVTNENGQKLVIRKFLVSTKSRSNKITTLTNLRYLTQTLSAKLVGTEMRVAYLIEEDNVQHLLERAIHNKTNIPIETINKIIFHSIIALQYLDREAIGHGIVQPRYINFNKGDYRLAGWGVYNFNHKHPYSAPEIFAGDPFRNPLNSYMFFSDVFSLGLTALQLMNILPESELKNIYSEGKMDATKLKYYLDAAKSNYSTEVARLVEKMLFVDPFVREDFLEDAVNLYVSEGMFHYPQNEIYMGSIFGITRHGKGTYSKAGDSETLTGNYFLDYNYGHTIKLFRHLNVKQEFQSVCGLIFGEAISTHLHTGTQSKIYFEANTMTKSEGHNTLSPKSTFVGKMVEGLFEGYGELTLSEGFVVTGNWVKGKPSGIMTLVTPMLKYVGTLDDDLRIHGKGRINFQGGDYYEGEIANEQPSGKGKMSYNDGRIFEGVFKDGVPNGPGKYSIPDGSYLEGNFMNYLGHGEMTLKEANGVIYKGGFENGVKSGYGKLTSPDGMCYEGEWKFDTPCGKGKMIYSKGEVYEGEFLDGLRHGQGRISSKADKMEYEGSWYKDQMHGEGRLKVETDGWEYEGEFQHSKRNGYGTIKYHNISEKYMGEWVDDVPEGDGKHWMQDGTIFYGEYKKGQIQGRGKIEFVNGDIYVGPFENGLPHGNGKYNFADGSVYNGEFKEGKRDGYGEYEFAEGTIWKGNWVDDILEGEATIIHRDGKEEKLLFKDGKPTGSHDSKCTIF